MNGQNDDSVFFILLFTGCFIFIAGMHKVSAVFDMNPTPGPSNFFDWIETIIGVIVVTGFCLHGWFSNKKLWVLLLLASGLILWKFLPYLNDPEYRDISFIKEVGLVFLESLFVSICIFSCFKIHDKNPPSSSKK